MIEADFDSENHIQKILEDKGRKALNKAKKVMLAGVKEKDLQAPLRYLAKNWNDTLRPTLMALSCEAVGGEAGATTSAATAMTLLCSSMNIYDNIMDRSKFKRFIPTLPGKFGDGLALIVAGLVTAKAFSVLYEAEKEIPRNKYVSVNKLFQDFILKMSEAEVANLNLRGQGNVNATEKFHVLQMQGADMEACTKIGATIGGGSESEVEQLGRYGLLLGTVTGLREDLSVGLNLTAELVERINGSDLPYVLIWTMNHSKRACTLLSSLAGKGKIEPTDVKEVVAIMFEANAVSHIRKVSENLIVEMKNLLIKIRECEAKQSLILLAEVQQSLLFKDFVVRQL